MVRYRLLRCIAVSGAVALLGVGCRPTDELERERQKLERASARWSDVHSSDYAYIYTHRCFCEQGGRAVLITVRADTVTAIEDASSGEPVLLSPLLYTTVDGLFEMIHDALLRDPDHLEATYDSRDGYPRTLAVDYSRTADDDEFGFSVTSLEFSSEH